jgi:putative DNA methylase
MTDFPVKAPRKLIEVALPLDAINRACAYEKMPGIGAHPRGIHLWWARRPLAAARAVIFSQLVNDPSWKWEMEHSGEVPPNNLKASWAASRKRLFKIIEELVLWENTTNEDVLNKAREEIRKSWRETCDLNKDHPQAAELFNPDKLPALHDPFAGGGAIPLEAQRLGLEAYASDLNPVAVLINKAMIEIPPKFAGRPPVNPSARGKLTGVSGDWQGAQGLAEDVRYYGAWMLAEAEKRIGHLYPPVEITEDMTRERPDLKPYVGQKLTVIAWLWARTVKSPNPAFSHVDVPLASTFILSNKAGKEAYVQPVVEGDNYRFTVKVGTPPNGSENGTKLARGANFRCLMSNTAMESDYIKTEGRAGRMGDKLMAIVVDGKRGRIYLTPTQGIEDVARSANPTWKPEQKLPDDHRNFWSCSYGLTTYGDLFTPRQLVALTTFSDLVSEAREHIFSDAITAGLCADSNGLENGGVEAKAYAEAVSIYLSFAVDRCADFNNAMTRWVPGNQKIMNLFGKQAIALAWDYPEAAILAETVGGFSQICNFICDCIKYLPSRLGGKATQADAQSQTISLLKSVSTDPPYYDNIAYADLSDFFYVWLRRCLHDVLPLGLSTISSPKEEELVALPYRRGGASEADRFFLSGMELALTKIASQSHPHAPITIYYAFKQSETRDDETSSTGWISFLEALTRAGLQLTGTWPLRSEQEYRMISMGTNALASSIVLVCRKRASDAPTISRREFIRELNAVLPEALDEMTKGAGDDVSPVAPVDLSQAIIGPGMAVFSKYSAVLEADGKPMSVRTALQLINRFLAEDDFDADTQWCLRWFDQNGWAEGAFGEADVLARAKATSVSGLVEAGVVQSGGGRVSIRKWADYPTNWNPLTDKRNPVWETLHHLIRALKNDGEASAGHLLAAVAGQGESVRQLAYRLYTLCERKGWAEDARAYNELITSWTGIEQAVSTSDQAKKQGELF